jgi:CubicO group peptidase (beta-lactamase class C family)
MNLSRTLALAALSLCAAHVMAAQSAPGAVEQQIDRVTSGLEGAVVIKGDAHARHTLAERMKELNVPGVSIAVIHDGRIEWARGFGVRGPGGEPVDAKTVFQAGSISKPLAAMAALRLVEDGKLSLDEDVNTYLTSWKLPASPVMEGKAVTLRELLTHTAGINVHGFPGYAKGEPVPTLVEVLNGEKPANTPAIRSEAAPGTHWQYSGGGYTIMQQMLIDVTKEPFAKLLHDTVLKPLGMKRSTYDQPLPEDWGDAAVPYDAKGEPLEGGAHTYPERAAAGLWTTPSDLARYAIAVQQTLAGNEHPVLTEAMAKQMVTPGMGHWGLGVEIGGSSEDPYFTHGGVNAGFQSVFVAYEKSGEGAAVMTNSDRGMEVAEEVMRSIATEYGWPDFKPVERTAVAVDPKILAKYVGTYHLGPGFDLVMTLENGQLMAQATGQMKIPLYPESNTKFFPTVIVADIDFSKDAQGKVTGLVLDQGGRDFSAPKTK